MLEMRIWSRVWPIHFLHTMLRSEQTTWELSAASLVSVCGKNHNCIHPIGTENWIPLLLMNCLSCISTSADWSYWAKLTLASATKTQPCNGISWRGWEEMAAGWFSRDTIPVFSLKNEKAISMLSCVSVCHLGKHPFVHVIIHKGRACWSWHHMGKSVIFSQMIFLISKFQATGMYVSSSRDHRTITKKHIS